MRVLKQIDDSRFWQRIERCERPVLPGQEVAADSGNLAPVRNEVHVLLISTIDNRKSAMPKLRLKMKQNGETRIRHCVFRHSEFRAQPARGTDEETGQQWLRVTDNGVGMTEERAAASPVGVPTTRLCRSNSRRMMAVSPRSTRSRFGWVLS